nr:hypothetical protein [Tanacetum cinerariifolium]
TLTVKKSVRPLSSHRLALRASRCSEAYLRWRSAPLSTMYPSTTSESSVGDSSSRSSARPSRKRCRSPVATMTSSIHATRALVPSRADLLPPRKRFSDSISPEDSVEDDIDTNVLRDIKADATAVEVAVDRDVEARVDRGIDIEIDVGIDVEDEVEDKVESNDKGSMEVGVDMDARIGILDGMLMPDAVDRLEQVQALLGIERDRVDSLCRHMALSPEEFRQVRKDRDDTRRRLRTLDSFVKRRLGFRP